MPTYAYACKDCGHRFDAVQSFAEPTLTECPACGGSLRKEYGSIGVTFNGSGFYRTDSRAADGKGSGREKKSSDKKSSDSAGSSTGGTSGSSGSSSSGASSKPEAKASPAPSGT